MTVKTFIDRPILSAVLSISIIIGLIGLLSKTAILLTEYASSHRRKGLTISGAAMAAAKARLRPILMTSLTMILGMLPLMFAMRLLHAGLKQP